MSTALEHTNVRNQLQVRGTVTHLQDRRYRFSVEQYLNMIRCGILTKNDRVELIRGEVINKMTIGDPHLGCVNLLTDWFSSQLAGLILVQVQSPVQLADSRPEPDISLLIRRADFYSSAAPKPADIHLLVEVADWSIDYDRDVKRPLYAQNGIREYWIVDINNQALEVYRQPGPNGYADIRVLHRGEQTSIEAFPNISLNVDVLFH
jgi:Uma2 family endonuclease